MYVTARSYLATGVAVVGASALAISPLAPVSPHLPDLTVPAISTPSISTVAVDLTSLANPIELWVQVITGAVDNAGALGQDWLSDPAPVLRQLITNQIGYLETLSTAGGDVVTGLVNYLSPSNPYGLLAELQNAFGQFTAGDIAQGVSTLITALITAPIVGAIGIPLLGSGLLDIPVQIAENATAAITAALSLNTALPLLLGALGPVLGPLNALGTTGQEIYDSLAAGDIVAALTAVVNIPAALTGAVLNGFTAFDGTFSPGLLSYDIGGFGGGILQAVLLTIPRTIAAAIGAAPSVNRAAFDEVSALTTESATTVTLDIAEATPAVRAESAEAAAPQPSGVAPAVTDAEEEPTTGAVTEEPVAEQAISEAPVAEEAPAAEETVESEDAGSEATEQDPSDESGSADSDSTSGKGNSASGADSKKDRSENKRERSSKSDRSTKGDRSSKSEKSAA